MTDTSADGTASDPVIVTQSRRTLLSALAFLANRFPDCPRVFGRTADLVNSTRDFLASHRRLPGRRGHLNDYFLDLVNSREILNPLRALIADKEHVKSYIASVVGAEHAVPTIGLVRSAAEVVPSAFPDRCVIKPTHLSGEVLIRTSAQQSLDVERIRGWFTVNWYKRKGGWEIQYRDLVPKVIIEPILFDDDNITDIKLFCARGRVGMIQVDVGRKSDHRRAIVTPSWELLPFEYGRPAAPVLPPRPANLTRMLEIASALSTPFSFIRVDMYSDGSSAMVGELTSCPGGALKRFEPVSAERTAYNLVFGG